MLLPRKATLNDIISCTQLHTCAQSEPNGNATNINEIACLGLIRKGKNVLLLHQNLVLKQLGVHQNFDLIFNQFWQLLPPLGHSGTALH